MWFILHLTLPHFRIRHLDINWNILKKVQKQEAAKLQQVQLHLRNYGCWPSQRKLLLMTLLLPPPVNLHLPQFDPLNDLQRYFWWVLLCNVLFICIKSFSELFHFQKLKNPQSSIFPLKISTPSSCTMALGSTQPLTEMSTRNLPGGKGWPACGSDNLTFICEPIVYKMWEPRCLTTLWAFTACYRIAFTCICYNSVCHQSRKKSFSLCMLTFFWHFPGMQLPHIYRGIPVTYDVLQRLSC
jgi:hypothetical protein